MISRIVFKLFLPSIALITMLCVIFHINPYKAPHASPGSSQVALQNFGHLPLAFEANIGQTAGPVKFISRGNTYTMFLTGSEAVLALRARDQKAENKNQKTPVCPARMRLSPPTTTSVLRLQLVGADDRANVMGLEELPGKTNYFIGNDPKKWRTNVPNFAKAKYEQVYPGIDLVYYGNQRQLEYDFVVAPNADPHAIRFAVQNGVSRNHNRMTTIDANGDLVLASTGGDVRMHKPVVYQPGPSLPNHASAIESRQPVESHYILTANNQVSLQLGAYDRSRPLVIDPVVSYATYLVGSGGDIGFGVAVDSSGNAYVVGRTGSSNFPTSSGAYDTSCGTDSNCNGSNDAFLTKLSADGSSVLYSTYLGGSGSEMGLAMAVDGADNAYLTGSTSSTDFPTTSTAFQKTLASSVSNAFVTKLNPAGNALVYSTYLGGNGSFYGDVGVAVAVDASGAAYVSGQTDSSNFPVKNAIQSAAGGGLACKVSCDWFTGLCTYTACPDAFVTKLSADGSSLVYSTYLGKQGTDSATGIAVDSNGNAYVGGYTNSSDFPTHNALQPNLGGGLDGFVLKLNPSGSALVFSTFLGGSANEYLETLTIDSGGNIYVGGATSSTDFPTVNPSQSSNAGGQSDAFVTEINAAGSSLVFSTYLGGTGVENALGIALDTKKNIYVMGETTSSDFPTVSLTQASPGGSADAFVAEFPVGGGAPLFATYLGGSGDEAYNGGFLAIDGAGNIIVVGDTASSNFPVVNALQPTYGGNTDAFVAKYSPISGPAVSLSPANLSFGDQTTCVTSAPKASTLTNSGNQALTINSIALSTGTEYAQTNNCPIFPATLAAGANCTISVTFKPTTTGAQNDSVVVASNAPGSPNTIPLTGNGVPPAPVVSLSATSLTFPDQLVNSKGTSQTVTLTNSGSAALTISTIASQTADFTESNDCPISPSKLAISSHCTITVNFDPGSRGSLSGSIAITDDAANSPQSVPLSGKGVIAQVLQLSTNTLDFGSQLVGSTSSSQTVTLTNGGDQDLTISGITVTGDFASTTTCSMSPATMSGGSPCTVTVKFTPTLTGTRDSTLTITHNAAGSPSTVTLKGTGTDFALGTQSNGSTTAKVTAGGSATYNLQIAPTGYSGNVALSCSFQGAQPRGTNCTVPSSVTLNGVDPATFTVSVTTTARSMLWPRWPTLPAPWKPIGYFTNPILLALLLLAAIAAISSGRCVSAGRTTKIAWVPAAGLLVITMIFAAYGCGGGGSTQLPPTGTPAGTYNLTLSATASGVTKNSILTLTVN